MFRAEGLLLYGQRLLVEWLSLSILALYEAGSGLA